MENSSKTSNGFKGSLHWLDLRVFYVRVSKCEIDNSTPEYLTLNHIPLNPDTLLEVNGVRTSIYSDGASTLLKRDRIDKKFEEVTFVSTDSIRLTGSVKFEVFNKDILVLSGVLELCNINLQWCMNCESVMIAGTEFLKAKQFMGPESSLPIIEVYVAGCFMGNPIILTKTLQLGSRKKHIRKGMLDSIPEHEVNEYQKEVSSHLPAQVLVYLNFVGITSFLCLGWFQYFLVSIKHV